MKKTLLFASLCLATSGVASAQVVEQAPKLNASLTLLMSKHREVKANPATRSKVRTLTVGQRAYSTAENISVTIDCEDAQALVEKLQADGFTARVATENVLTARISMDAVERIAAMPEVKHIALARRFQKKMNKARAATNVTKVHSGEGLETPFTGKGVVIGVIDQGFQYDHAAFKTKDGKQRVRAVWDFTKKNSQPTTNIPTGGEKKESHATHVTGIAAGTDLSNKCGGVAPDADIIMMPSTFDDDEIINGVKYVKEFAEKEGKPWVVNMSFGSQIGPHDGTQLYDQTIEKMIGKGGFVTAANGNEGGQKIHAMAEVPAGETRYLIFSRPDNSENPEDETVFFFSALAADSVAHFKLTPVIYADGKMITLTAEQWKKAKDKEVASFVENINEYNKKQELYGEFNLEKFEDFFDEEKLGERPRMMLLALKVESVSQTPQTFHAWIEASYYGEFSELSFQGESARMVRGDDQYLVGEGASTIPSAVSVASFNTATSWYAKLIEESIETAGEPYSSGEVGGSSIFSSAGPYLGNGMKPLVAAPGSYINSAFNAYDSDIDYEEDEYVTDVLTVNGKKQYYGMMEGTSMASPFMAGVLALWLEAYPQLSYEQVVEIVKKTSVRDNKVGTEEWTRKRGYGKIDAYAGLKEALQLASVSGIDHVGNSAIPVSILKSEGEWNILFNNAERFANIRVFATDGRLVKQQSLSGISQGQDTTLSFRGLTPGAYLVQIVTAGSTATHRVIVQ